MKKVTFKMGSAILIVLLSAGVLASCNDSKNSNTTDSTTVKVDTSKKMMSDTSHKMMTDTGKKGDQLPPPR